ncbi:DUF3306 domain-containing protein [Bradyrhizobium sp. Leo121]|uniref:DUF3306 domain-containing protein n=1 Tax=Bradyrhizobium sp. Leo121 TaxID=1571195 RepID=UPI0010295DF8|nr:DUF3306 domain-containing protein [Bradyrhizobium sp. Leo121]RZN17960.1 DUF3306 domain-containing protein [Bradyrhizobium sp. Leo121]
MAEEHNVFLRWARLKQAAKERPDTEAAPTDNQEAAAPPAADAAGDEPFDLASLPSIESILANTDITAFLRAGVPAELTRAALRRAWTSDPAIRDFIGIAENQWDFNDPTAIPGFGPLGPTENATDLLAQVSRRLEQVPDTLSDMTSPADTVRPAAANSAEPVLDPPPATEGPSLADAAAQSNEMQDLGSQGEQAPREQALESPRKRRHGSALPQ